ncbi:tetratricopeptide repeat protein [Streptomyces albidoflavus]|uniref:tetratricopeptide repeat protein n=1 Tax=Streptomyces albidoflavus TaxID=1886 RepID=UPI001C46300B|nr:tetratricopeptide repeat protein [Streptomyces albidoflavus]MBV7653184.1 tetratricopeptide repeat protein [Streptomyces albidoflavus]MBV7708690.1 tetratricopeptide repeat protein [Streptomyces albidoflavus]
MAEQRGQAADDPVMTRIGQIAMLQHAGDREEAQQRFAALWEEIGPHADPLHRCTLAHYMADTQQDPAEELRWDLLALEAADGLTDGSAAPAVRGFYPSLHLNLAADYARLGRPDTARDHLREARAHVDALADDGHGHQVLGGIERLERELAAADGPAQGTPGSVGRPRAEGEAGGG